jgi:hypothetical protein
MSCNTLPDINVTTVITTEQVKQAGQQSEQETV